MLVLHQPHHKKEFFFIFNGEFLYFHVSRYLWSFHRIIPRRVRLCFLTLFHRGSVLIVKVPSILLSQLFQPLFIWQMHLFVIIVFGYSSDLLQSCFVSFLYWVVQNWPQHSGWSLTISGERGRITSFILLPALCPTRLRMLLTFFAGTSLFNLLSAGPQLFFCQAGFQPPEHTDARGYSFPGAGLCSLC